MATEITYGDRVAYLPGPDVLALADLHVGRDAASNVELPLGERGDLVDRLDAAVDRFDPSTVVFAGDYLHAFDDVPRGVPETVAEIEALVAGAGADLVVTPGNHDPALPSVSDADRQSTYRVGGTVFCHGHEQPAPEPGVDRYVVGHEHPVVAIEGRRRPCFLYGRGVYGGADALRADGDGDEPDENGSTDRGAGGSTDGGADVLVLPAFTRLAAGSPVGRLEPGEAHSPLLSEPGAFRPVITVEGEALEFPPLSTFRALSHR